MGKMINFIFHFTAASILMSMPCIAAANLSWKYRNNEVNASITDQNVSAKYPFSNTGTQPIHIRSVTTGCDCTSGKLDKSVYQPGESGTLTATFTISGRQGLQEKSILVETDDPVEPTVRLILRVRIPTLATFSPRYAFWDLNADPKPKTLLLQLDPAVAVTADGTPIKVVGVTSSNAAVVADFKEIEPGRKYEITVHPTSTTRPVAASILLQTDPPTASLSQYRAFVRVGQPTPSLMIPHPPATRPTSVSTRPMTRPASPTR